MFSDTQSDKTSLLWNLFLTSRDAKNQSGLRSLRQSGDSNSGSKIFIYACDKFFIYRLVRMTLLIRNRRHKTVDHNLSHPTTRLAASAAMLAPSAIAAAVPFPLA